MKIISKLLPASKKKLVISSIGVLALVVFSSLILFEATKAEVVLTENGEKRTVKTHADTVDELLEEVGIAVGEHDALSHNSDAQIENGMKINYEEAKQIIVTIDDKEQEYFTTADTVGEFLDENSLKLSDRDDISHESSVAIEDGLNLSIAKAYQVTIDDGGDEKKVWTTGGTIEQFLHTNKITLNELDKIKPAIDEQVTKGTPITIVRVEKVTDVVEEQVAYKTEKRKNSSLEKGEEKVVSAGKEGLLVKKYEVIMENGKEVSRELVSEEVKEESENRVVAIGTKEPVVVETVSRSNNSSGEVLYMTASAYTAKCSGCSGYTSTGINLNANPNMKVIAVDPNVIPLGSKVWVEGYGYAIAGDTGGHIHGNRIDLHFPTKADAYSFGRKSVKVKIID